MGAQNVSLVLQVPAQLGAMFSALLLLAVLSALSWRRYRVQWRTPRSDVPSREKELVG